MRLRVLTIKNVEFPVTIESDQTVLQLKEKIYEQNSQMNVSNQKLIHNGIILKDEQKISDYEKIKENDRVVIIMTKNYVSRVPSPPAATETTPATTIPKTEAAATSGNTSNPSTNPTTSTPPQPTPPAQATTPNPAVPPASTQRVDGFNPISLIPQSEVDLENSISLITSMGFTPEAARGALEVSGNNPDTAIDLLTEMDQGMPAPNMAQEPSANDAMFSDGSLPLATNQGGNPFDWLRSIPQFNELRETIRTDAQNNPNLQAQILEQFRIMSPELFQFIQGHEEEFLNLLFSQPGEDDEEAPQDNATSQPGQDAAPPAVTVSLTMDEMQSVQRLETLGFTRSQVIEAFLACDKNEDLAANYLFDIFY